MVDVDAEHLLELAPPDDQDPVEAVAPDGADPALGERVVTSRRLARHLAEVQSFHASAVTAYGTSIRQRPDRASERQKDVPLRVRTRGDVSDVPIFRFK
jgi:hypothetical protein